MRLFARFNKLAFLVFARTTGWTLLITIFPAAVYTFTHSLWMGVKIFLLFGAVITAALLWAFWAAIFPKYEGSG